MKPNTTKFAKGMKKHKAHQTKRELDDLAKKYLYDFEYEGVRMRLFVELTVAHEITGKARLKTPDED